MQPAPPAGVADSSVVPPDLPDPAATDGRGDSDRTARVLVLTRPGCHLCADALAVVAAVCAETGATWAEQDITGDPELTRRWTDAVPVTFVDGAQHDFWRVSPDRLRAALAGRR